MKRDTMKRTRKRKNNNWANQVAAPAIPVKPNIPATMEIIRNIKAQPSMVITPFQSEPVMSCVHEGSARVTDYLSKLKTPLRIRYIATM